MKQSMAAQIEELRGMTVAGLVPRYRELWGKEPRVKHQDGSGSDASGSCRRSSTAA